MAGSVTTLGSKSVARRRPKASQDAACVAALRAAGGRVVGKTNLSPFCFGTTGINVDFGTPMNPRWPALLPGGSSSGSAAAVASFEADLGLGTDTTGSVRIPAACCGVVGIKLTNGGSDGEGVWTLSAGLDSIGLLSRNVSDAKIGLDALGLSVDGRAARRIGRVLVPGVDPSIERVVDLAFAAAGMVPDRVRGLDWTTAARAAEYIVITDAQTSIGALFEGEGVECSIEARTRLERAARIEPGRMNWALEFQKRWIQDVRQALDEFDVIAMPTLQTFPPLRGGPLRSLNLMTGPVNLAGMPAIALPLAGQSAPVSLQLVGREHAEGELVATAALFQKLLAQPAKYPELIAGG